MRQRLIDRAKRALIRRLRTRYEMIQPIPTQGMFNFRCHENCVQYVRDRPGERLGIVETIYVDGDFPILHYLVHDLAAGTYREVTLGWLAPQHEYYLIRPVHPSDFDRIHAEFSRARADWAEEFVGWFGRAVLRIKPEDVL
ncbi:MAG: hypothetical protein EAS51_00180 [Microbacteriaceae bacterium]|nr:MAG: hypothetical protein EAS51_00180 [Microbacteriaceae bacterium]